MNIDKREKSNDCRFDEQNDSDAKCRFNEQCDSNIKCKLHILSDLHLEFYGINSLTELTTQIPSLYQDITAELRLNCFNDVILILAGDINYITSNSYWDFLADCTKYYQQVICIPGNHEYYQTTELPKKTYIELNELIRFRANLIPNLHYLLGDKITIDRGSNKYTFIGNTMWSIVSKKVTTSIKDYKYIYDNERKVITSDFITNLHRRQVQNLLNLIQETSKDLNAQIVIITHHLPIPELVHPKYQQYILINQAFVTYDLPDEIFDNRIKLWICGHTHTPMNVMKKGIQFICNPVGYKGENSNPKVLVYELK